MAMSLDLDAVHDTVARMKDPACDPNTVVEALKRKIDAGEIDRVYTAKVDEYMAIAAAETNGDVFGVFASPWVVNPRKWRIDL